MIKKLPEVVKLKRLAKELCKKMGLSPEFDENNESEKYLFEYLDEALSFIKNFENFSEMSERAIDNLNGKFSKWELQHFSKEEIEMFDRFSKQRKFSFTRTIKYRNWYDANDPDNKDNWYKSEEQIAEMNL